MLMRHAGGVGTTRCEGHGGGSLTGAWVGGLGWVDSTWQLLDIFAQLEEQNLFLIQNCQETEEALEELKMKYRETKQRMDAETDGLQAQIDVLQSAIKVRVALSVTP